jgi:hypothetical protein
MFLCKKFRGSFVRYTAAMSMAGFAVIWRKNYASVGLAAE